MNGKLLNGIKRIYVISLAFVIVITGESGENGSEIFRGGERT